MQCRQCGIINTMKQLRASLEEFLPVYLVMITFLVSAFLLTAPADASAAELQTIELMFQGQDLFVSTQVVPDDSFIEELRQGLSKELRLSFEIMNIRSFFPDEYILGKKLRIALKSDPIKREFSARVSDGMSVQEKRFKDIESMHAWALRIQDLKVTNVKELAPGDYYLKVTAESRIRKLPPLIKYLLFFIPETEFAVWRYSRAFSLPSAQP
ncbi:MAG: hypothetical protein FD164_1184 [Nitrospirae bacterium]|nr:MAG: hypothetical protein FD164_1184 [Nitrospirota bacterium]